MVALNSILVTGSAGFLGRAFVAEFRRRGADVEFFDIADEMEKHRESAMDQQSWFEITDRRYDLVVPCAYHVGGRAGIDGNKAALAKNLMLDAALFDWSVRTGTRVLYLSSSAVYPTDMQDKHWWEPLTETVMAAGLSDADYGFAKAAGERLARNAQAQGVPVHIVRPFSGYGPGQSLDYPFPSFVKRAKERQDPFEVWGDPESKRDWIHVTDLVRGALAVVEADYQDPVNLCTGIGTSFADLARMCMAAAGYEAPIQANASAPMGVFARVGDPTRMLQFYTPQVSIQQGVEEAINGSH